MVVLHKNYIYVVIHFIIIENLIGGGDMAKVGLMQKAKMQKRHLRKFQGRKKMLETIPWHDGEEEIHVMDCLNPDGKLKAKVTTIGRGYDKGLMFELASKPLILGIECPKCGGDCELNIHWPCFMHICNDGVKRAWEML